MIWLRIITFGCYFRFQKAGAITFKSRQLGRVGWLDRSGHGGVSLGIGDVSDPAKLKQVAQEVKNLNYRSTPRSTRGYGRYVPGCRELKTDITRRLCFSP
jgi:hypothetical protein